MGYPEKSDDNIIYIAYLEGYRGNDGMGSLAAPFSWGDSAEPKSAFAPALYALGLGLQDRVSPVQKQLGKKALLAEVKDAFAD